MFPPSLLSLCRPTAPCPPRPAHRRPSAGISRRSFLTFVLLAVVSSATIATAAGNGRTVRLLTVGNSFSRNATRHLDALATAAGDTLIHRPIVVGGASLELHATKALQHERDPQDKDGRYADGRSLREALIAEPWDYVTIQQASIKSHDVNTYRPFARQLFDTIKRHAPAAEVLLHVTWEYRRDDPRFAAPAPAGEPPTADAMYRGLTDAYRTIAQELGLRRIPVGDAFHLANADPQWGYRPPAQPVSVLAYEPPALPEQIHSLNVGWNWKKKPDGTMTLNFDGHHANLAGEYLGACVWYEVLFRRGVQDNSFVPEGLDPAYARFLQDVAHRAVTELESSPPLPR